mgnify:FL=1
MSVPGWLELLTTRAPELTAADFRWQAMPETQEREAAVLVL